MALVFPIRSPAIELRAGNRAIESNSREEADMNAMFFRISQWFYLCFWASHHEPMAGLFTADALRIDRMMQKLKCLDPGFPRDDPPPDLSPPPSRPFPADVPAPEPHDVPVPEPRDVPPPDPGKNPSATPHQPQDHPRPRPIP
jgi:hypothetical protein